MAIISFSIHVHQQLVEQFNIALKLNNDSKEEVFETFVRKYISDTFLSVGKSVTGETKIKQIPSKNTLYTEPIAKKRIPLWAKKPHQINHKIIKAFLQVQDEKGAVTISDLSGRCGDKINHPDTYVEKFYGNYAQMKTDEGHPHGKVFVEDNGFVEIWSEVNDVFNMYERYFK